MVCSVSSRLFILNRPALFRTTFHPKYVSTKACDPLRILFCGSDDFSIASLKALHAEHVRAPETIASIDVVCRPGKPIGRARKIIRQVPIKAVATNLCLPIHEVDTFRKWTPPKPNGEPINLVVAVSFGLFVPFRILGEARYGGLNVHPSMLPDFRGPAPVHRTLLAGDRMTGVTLQTLDPMRFDHGQILDQTAAPGFPIPNPDSCDLPLLLDLVSKKGAKILVDGIRNRLFVPPINAIAPQLSKDNVELRHARKITPEDRRVQWDSWSWDVIRRYQIVLGALWNTAPLNSSLSKETQTVPYKRMIFGHMKTVDTIPGTDSLPSIQPGIPFAFEGPLNKKEHRRLYIFTCDSKLLEIEDMKVEGERMAPAYRAARKAKFIKPEASSETSLYSTFYGPLK